MRKREGPVQYSSAMRIYAYTGVLHIPKVPHLIGLGVVLKVLRGSSGLNVTWVSKGPVVEAKSHAVFFTVTSLRKHKKRMFFLKNII